MAWRIEVTDTAKKQLAKFDRQVQLEIMRYLREKIATEEDPRRHGAPLRRELLGRWKYRAGAYRIICEIQDEKVLVLVLMAGHRSKVCGRH
ncbi:MAG: type II toxin-antitoxin system RelE family toxin [Desulfurivibrionaceae bacterium]|nr:type II toxin-antitoxin system RelE/ParE family toxin [Pseudomonadota bacterium]MCG2823678.1 type II toxin-antitoxin system RelE/ParE family toxin [Desulfobulbaceae bacterium]MDP2758766.1 type II toxin-antitoxin system RelE/ParE family toxin [Desulfurivibrionaceae bacterium]PKN23157.1 MAG: type II toxin-antitoxin system mRNA interferase toxin, RelE/StbE family [Deltaproteobacteria bacterium HGW-Deltaproteobacteria-3]MBU4229556.1 type II toxin-antitoxin system RelE/ParE family toxin [Pseudomo